jgi:hypothetical protein
MHLSFTATTITGNGVFIIRDDITKPGLFRLIIQWFNNFNGLDLIHAFTPLTKTGMESSDDV